MECRATRSSFTSYKHARVSIDLVRLRTATAEPRRGSRRTKGHPERISACLALVVEKRCDGAKNVVKAGLWNGSENIVKAGRRNKVVWKSVLQHSSQFGRHGLTIAREHKLTASISRSRETSSEMVRSNPRHLFLVRRPRPVDADRHLAQHVAQGGKRPFEQFLITRIGSDFLLAGRE